MRFKDYTGQTINGFKFIRCLNKKIRGDYIWEVQCHCGKIFEKIAPPLVNGPQKSCGCSRNGPAINRADYTGKTKNGLKFIKYLETNKKGEAVWEMKCFCGRTFKTQSYKIKTGEKKSCGSKECRNKTKIRKIENLSGQTINKWMIIDIAYFDFDSTSYWYCQCECGKIEILSSKKIKSKKSCGCHKIINRCGQKQGKLTYTEKTEIIDGKRMWLCICECGNQKWTNPSKKTKSCGCLLKPKILTEKEKLLKKEKQKQKAKEKYREKMKNMSEEELKEYKEKQHILTKKWYKENRDKILQQKRKEYQENEEKRMYQQEYARKYNKTEKGRKIQRKQRKKQMKNPKYRIIHNLRKRLQNIIKERGIIKSDKTMKLIGCSRDKLVSHLEKQFQEGMSWDNYGKWHIDHIRPCCSFDLSDPQQQKECFHYTNLQPLWAEDNIKKSGKWNDEDYQ